MDNNAWKVLAELLGMASDEFSNHSCNDYELPNTPDNLKLVKLAEDFCFGVGSGKELIISKDGTMIYTMDYVLVNYFIHLTKELAGT